MLYNRPFQVILAVGMFEKARRRAQWRRVWHLFNSQAIRLLDLETLAAQIHIENRHSAGIRSVPISQIQGSTGRSHDFDRGFYPIQEHTKSRWINVATALLMDIVLPAIDVIKIGQIYFVTDGHHRISVMRAIGADHIEANVTQWSAAGPLPWEVPARGKRNLAGV